MTEEEMLKENTEEDRGRIYVEKKGLVQVYRYPYNSMSYHLTNLSVAKENFYSGIACAIGTPLMSYFLVSMNDNLGSMFYLFLALGIGGFAYGVRTIIKAIKDQEQIKASIVDKLCEIEPDVLNNEDARRTLIKKL